MAQSLAESKAPSFPLHFPIGLALALFFWAASWTHLGALGEYAFFPQWLGISSRSMVSSPGGSEGLS